MDKIKAMYEGLELLQMFMNELTKGSSVSISHQLQEYVKELTELDKRLADERTFVLYRQTRDKIADCVLLLLECASHIGCNSEDLKNACIRQFFLKTNNLNNENNTQV